MRARCENVRVRQADLYGCASFVLTFPDVYKRQPEIQTVFLMADPALRDVSSTHARDLILSGKISDSSLPPVAAAYIAAIPDLEERRKAFGKQ